MWKVSSRLSQLWSGFKICHQLYRSYAALSRMKQHYGLISIILIVYLLTYFLAYHGNSLGYAVDVLHVFMWLGCIVGKRLNRLSWLLGWRLGQMTDILYQMRVWIHSGKGDLPSGSVVLDLEKKFLALAMPYSAIWAVACSFAHWLNSYRDQNHRICHQ